ncbi:hypothetical protein U1Q18_042871 [Sarracenia purpurea var. burkii]
MSGPSREQALSLLAQANNHGDLAVKLSSLKQAKDILASVDPSLAAELFPYLVELQYSPEALVRKSLIEAVVEIGLKAIEHSSILMPVLLALLRDSDSLVARQSIVSGTNIFCSILEELSLQFRRQGMVEKWLEELWAWMLKFKDAVFGILWEAGSAGTKLLALKFLETYVLVFTSNANDSEKPSSEALARSGRAFNISWLVGGHPVLDPAVLTSEANRSLGILLNLLRSASNLPGQLTITVVTCLAAIAKKRPLFYNSVLSALLEFETNFETTKGGHAGSIQYSLRTAFLGFLRCTYPAIVESRDRLLRTLRGMNAGDAADQVIRQVDKMMKNNERASRDARLTKDELSSQLSIAGDAIRKRSMPLENEEPNNGHDAASKRIGRGPNTHSDPTIQKSDSGQDFSANGVSSKVPLLNSGLTPVEQMIAMIGALIAEGERGAESLEILISQIHPDLLADIVITNMKHLPKNTPPLMRLNSLSVTQQSGSSGPPSIAVPIVSTASIQSPVPAAQPPSSSSNATNTSLSDMSTSVLIPADSKRDPRRDPRRHDPRRATIPVEVPPTSIVEDTNHVKSEFVDSSHVVTSVENTSSVDLQMLESSTVSRNDQPPPKEEVLDEEANKIVPVLEVNTALDSALSPIHEADEDLVEVKTPEIETTDEAHTSTFMECDRLSPGASNMTISEEACPDLPVLPSYIELTEEQQRNVRKLAVERIIESYKHLRGTDCRQTRMALLARLVAQVGWICLLIGCSIGKPITYLSLLGIVLK